MALQIKRKDGTIVEVHDGAMRLQAQIRDFGMAEVRDPKTGTTFQVERLGDGSLAEAAAPSIH